MKPPKEPPMGTEISWLGYEEMCVLNERMEKLTAKLKRLRKPAHRREAKRVIAALNTCKRALFSPAKP